MSQMGTCWILLALLSSVAWGQARRFEVVSAKASERVVGPDYNNQLVLSEAGMKATNATLRRLVAEAYRVQLNQIIGPNWIDQNEYDIEAKAGRVVDKRDLFLMLRTLLADRFGLKQHGETRNLRVFELVVDRGGPGIQPANGTEERRMEGGFHFRGDMRELADLIALQLNIPAPIDPSQPAIAAGPPTPVLDKTNLTGTYEFRVDLKPELGVDGLTIWQRLLPEQLGLRLNAGRGDVAVIVVDSASRVPTAN